MEDWIDRHSVTCALCGGLADERETQSLWPDDYDEIEPGAPADLYERLPDGEAHMGCFDRALEKLAQLPIDQGIAHLDGSVIEVVDR